MPRPEQLSDHQQRLTQARKRAQWELGDPSWADLIVDAYCAPEDDAARLIIDQEA